MDEYASVRATLGNTGFHCLIGFPQQVMPSLSNNSEITRQQVLLGPSICYNIWGNWSIYDVLNAGYLSNFSDHLSHLAVQHYPNGACRGFIVTLTR